MNKDCANFAQLLSERPGELARRFDYALRLCARDKLATARLLAEFEKLAGSFSTPVLLTLRNFLPARLAKAPVRIFWPKGSAAKAVSCSDSRPSLSPETIRRAVSAVERELLQRFAARGPLGDCVIDRALREIAVPFNERTASRSAIALPRGSKIGVAKGEIARLFLHWRQPETGGYTSDLDLSVGFYSAAWNYVGVCSYYELTCESKRGRKIAVSAGDLRNAPFPEGATEFVDIYRDAALEAGARYAVMVVTNYAGMPFSALESGFAGIMLRTSAAGEKFDPRAVKLKFAVQGENGVFLPLVYDLKENCLHWLDAYSKGSFAFNNVARSNSAICKICPEMIAYFASGIRMSMFELALLHAAARGRRVFLRDGNTSVFERGPEETATAFLSRITKGNADRTMPEIPETLQAPAFAALLEGDVPLADGASAYVLFPGTTQGTISASDLIA